MVSEDKLCLWLVDDLLLRRVPPRNTTPGLKRKKGTVLGKRKRLEAEEREMVQEAEMLARQLGVPVAEVPVMLADDRLEYMPPAVLRGMTEAADGEVEEVEGPPGSLYVRSTLDAYVAAVLELWEQQRQDGLNKHDHPRGSALEGLLQKRARERDRNDREAFADRGEGGIAAGYTAAEFLKMQEVLLTGAAQTVQVSLAPLHKLMLTTCLFRTYELVSTSSVATTLSFVEKPAGSSSSLTSPSSSTRSWRALHPASPLSPSCRVGRRLGMGRRSSWGPCAIAILCCVLWAL
jgi:hypothetical protein